MGRARGAWIWGFECSNCVAFSFYFFFFSGGENGDVDGEAERNYFANVRRGWNIGKDRVKEDLSSVVVILEKCSPSLCGEGSCQGPVCVEDN